MTFKTILTILAMSSLKATAAVTPTSGSLIINEIMSANVDQYFSPTVNFDGWVELYNPSDTEVTLTGCYFSDDAADLTKWKAPAGMGTIPAGGYKVVWFDNNLLKNTNVPFKLDTDGGTLYISAPDGTLLASEEYPEAIDRTSYARTTDGGNDWSFTAQPTLGTSNANTTYATQQVDMPEVSLSDQLFSGTLKVDVTIPAGCTLRYTTDGTLPTTINGLTSQDGHFTVRNTTCYRFRLFADNQLPSRPVTRSYIRRDKNYTGHVVSVVADPDFLYGNEHGVMVRGTNGKPGNGQSSKCNWNMDWERPVNFAFILPGGHNTVLNQDVNLEMCGGWSRAWEPHSFKLKGNKELSGDKNLKYPFFAEKPYLRNRTLQIRNGGNDNWNRFKDPAIESIILTSGIDIDAQSYLPVHEFINGQYIGMLNMREPNNKHFVYANFGWDDEEIDQFEINPDSLYLQNCGTEDAFLELYELSKQAANADTYEEIKQRLDIDEYINYMAMELYLGSDDWPHNNLKGYAKRDGGKFRFVSFDLDFAFNRNNPFTDFANERYFTSNWLYDKQTTVKEELKFVTIFLNLLNNAQFRRQFIDTFCVMGGSVFEPTRCAAVIDSLAERAYPLQNIEGGTPWNMANELKERFGSRLGTMTNAIRNYSPMRLTNVSAQRATISSTTSGAQLFINDTPIPTGEFNGHLFAPVTLKAVAPAGTTFLGWANATSLRETLFDYGTSWNYYDNGSLSNVSWQSTNYNASSWKTGNAPLGYGKDGLATVISYGSNANNKYPTYYFRKSVTLDKAPDSNTKFVLEYTVDDGFVVYVNGKEAGRYNMPGGNVNYNTWASTYAPNNPDSGEMTFDASFFNAGENIIAVEVHNNSATSSDIYWDAKLSFTSPSVVEDFYSTDAEISIPQGAFNLVACFESLSSTDCLSSGITPVRVNEVSADNSVYINDLFKKADWVELYNTTDAPIDVEGMYLSDDEDKPQKYCISKENGTANTIIPAHGHILVWCDKQKSGSELHANFKLAKEGGTVTLSAADMSWTDRLPYPEHDGNSTVGRYPDGTGNIYVMTLPTIRKTNYMNTYATLFMDDINGIGTPVMNSRDALTLRFAANKLMFRGDSDDDFTIDIYTLSGQLVQRLHGTMQGGYGEVAVRMMAEGCYVARATGKSGKTASCKFVF